MSKNLNSTIFLISGFSIAHDLFGEYATDIYTNESVKVRKNLFKNLDKKIIDARKFTLRYFIAIKKLFIGAHRVGRDGRIIETANLKIE